MEDAAKDGDIFVTLTGCKHVICQEHFALMKSGAVLANAGHFDLEINKEHLAEMATSRRTVRKNIEEFIMADGRKIYLLAEGRLVNLAAGDGHPTEIMDLSFAMQALAVLHILEHHQEMENKVFNFPEEVSTKVATLKLSAMGLTIDALTAEQKKYLMQA